MRLFLLIPHFTGVERNQGKEKFSSLFKVRSQNKFLGLLTHSPIFFPPLCSFSSLVDFPSLNIVPKLAAEFTFP